MQEITTRYVCSFDCLPGRRNKIWQNWRFLCRCRRCRDPTDLGTHFSALRCRECPAGGFLHPRAGCEDVLAPPWSCDGCGACVGPRHVADRLIEYEVAMKAGFFASKGDLEEYLAGEVHPNHFLMCTLMQKR